MAEGGADGSSNRGQKSTGSAGLDRDSRGSRGSQGLGSIAEASNPRSSSASTSSALAPASKLNTGPDAIGGTLDPALYPDAATSSTLVEPSGFIAHPRTPYFVFVIEVTPQAILNNSVASVCQSIKSLLPYFRGTHAKIAIVTFDSTVHFYSFSDANPNGDPQMIIMSDVHNPFPAQSPNRLFRDPKSDDAIGLENLLDSIPVIFEPDYGSGFKSEVSSGFKVPFHSDASASIGGDVSMCSTNISGSEENCAGHNSSICDGTTQSSVYSASENTMNIPPPYNAQHDANSVLPPSGDSLSTTAGSRSGNAANAGLSGSAIAQKDFVDDRCCSQAACKAAVELLRVRGGTGQVMMFQCSLPNHGLGACADRDDLKYNKLFIDG